MLVDSIMMIYMLVFPYFLCFLTGSKKMVYGHIAIWGIYNHISVWALNKPAEIWFHAYAYYSALPMATLCSVLGYDGIENTKFWRSLKNGIDIGSTKDCEKEFGVCRYVIFRAAYAYAVANPCIL